MADRLQARAVRRMGELLKQFRREGRPSKKVAPIDNVQILSHFQD